MFFEDTSPEEEEEDDDDFENDCHDRYRGRSEIETRILVRLLVYQS